MNKAELIAKIAQKSGFTKKASEKALNAILKTTSEALAEQEKVRLSKFGAFEVKNRRACTVHHPRTGEMVRIREAKIPTFKPSVRLKKTINDR